MPIQVFGQGAVQTAYVSYLPLDIRNPPLGNGSITLVWPTSYVDVPFRDPNTHIYYQALAASMNVTTPATNLNTITLPDARQATVGANFIITNVGASSFTLNKSDGTPLIVIPNTALANSYWVQLTDNSTADGTWYYIQFGAGTSDIQAAALAGYGLVSDNRNKLNTNVNVVRTGTVPVIDNTFNATIFIWTGGAQTINLPTVASVPAGYYVSFNNQGTDPIDISTTDGSIIDNENIIQLDVGQSLTIISDGNNWWTLGLGLGTNNNFILQDRPVGPGGDVFLTPEQTAVDGMNFTGTLTSNVTVHLANLQRFWFLRNNTSGPYTLSVQLASTGSTYLIPQNSSQIFYSNTTTIFPSPTSLQSFTFLGQELAPDGSSATPSYSFLSTPNSGIFYDSLLNRILFSINGVQNFSINNGQILAPNGIAATPSYSFSSSNNTGMVYDPINNSIGFGINGQNIAGFYQSGTISALQLNHGLGGVSLSIQCDNTVTNILYNSINTISISNTGAVSFPQRAETLNNIMPPSPATGTIVYFNGTNWVNLAPPVVGGAATAYLKITKATGVPFWSDT